MKINKKIMLILLFPIVSLLSYSIYSVIRCYSKNLPSEILKNPNVSGFKKIIREKDFEEIYTLEIEMKDSTVIKFHWVKYDFFGNIKFSCIEGINKYKFPYFIYNKQSSRIEHINQSYMFEKSIQHYLNRHNLSTVLNNYKEIEEASNKIMELSDEEISFLLDLYKNKSDASSWIKSIDKKHLLETKEKIEGCYKISSQTEH